MKISRLFNSFRKRLAAGVVIATAALLPMAASAASTVKIEADTHVANATKSGSWAGSATAAYDEVVAVEVVYNNDEAAGSGKTANNLRVKINLPTTAGSTQNITTKTSSDNSNTVDGSATVNLSRSDAYLQYIPGTATWKHATTVNGNMTTTQKVSDDVVTAANGLVLENENPCQAGSIVIQARVVVPSVSVDKYVRAKGTTNWATSVNAKPGDTVQYEIAYKNTGNTTENDVEFRDQLPKGITYVPGTTMLKDGVYPSGTKVNSDAVVSNGFVANSYAAGAAAYVMFDAKVATEAELPACGDNLLRNTAYVQPKDMNYFYNTADVHVTKTCTTPTTPTYSCDTLTIAKGDERNVTANVSYTAKDGATFKSASFDWGDSTTATSGTATSATHTYAKDGTYKVAATLTFDVNGTTKTVSGGDCAQSVSFTTTPPATPVYSCDMLTITQGDNRTVTASLAYTAQNGATFKTVTIDWGDKTTPLTTTNTTNKYQYTADGTYTVSAKVLFSVNGSDKFAADNAACTKQVSFTPPTTPNTPQTPTTPSELPNTGAGDIIGMFAGVVVLGAIGYRMVLSRQLGRR